MNMEIALLLAHLCLMPTAYEVRECFFLPKSSLVLPHKNEYFQADSPEPCRIMSILLNFFYLACFAFMLLEAIYLYSMVGWVVQRVNYILVI